MTSTAVKAHAARPAGVAGASPPASDVRPDDAGALFEQAGRAGPADARRRPGDDHVLARQPSHGTPSLSRRSPTVCRRVGWMIGPCTVQFALFYEIPVAHPWGPDSEHTAYKNVLAQAVAGERYGWDAFWTVEHHFLSEFSHCSNPEVLYGAVAALTERIRIGYGVRLMPQPYNHPVRTAESVAVLDLLSDGRVDLGTGRSSTRAELEGFGVDPAETRAMWQEAIGHVVGCWTNDEYELAGTHWQMPKRRVLPKPRQSPHPPIWGATSSEDGHRQVGVARPGPVLVRRRGLPPGGEDQGRHLPRGRRHVHQPHRRVREQSGCHLHHGPVRPRPRRRARPRPGVVRVVPEDRRPSHRVDDGLDDRTPTGPGLVRLRGGHEEDRRRGSPRPAVARVPRRGQCLCAGHPRGLHQDGHASTRKPASTSSCAW